MSVSLEDIMEPLASAIVSTTVGFVWGTIDVLSSGYPVLTIGAPVWEMLRFSEARNFCKKSGYDPSLDLANYGKGLLYYSLGATLPFTLHYSSEIAEYLAPLIEKL